MYTPVNPSFFCIKGVEVGQNYIGMFSWCFSMKTYVVGTPKKRLGWDCFYSSTENKCYGYSFEAPRQGVCNEYPRHIFYGELAKGIPELLSSQTHSE